MKRMKAMAAAVAALALVGLARAEDLGPPDLGPPVGAAIPGGLEAKDSMGAPRSFETLVGESGMALYFIRSVDWCPYCQAQTIDVNRARAKFAERGLSIVMVSYDSPAKQSVFLRKNNISVTLLSDPDSSIIDAFGLRNKKYKAGSKFAGIPYPAVFIVAPDRTIRAKLYEEDFATNDKSYKSRPAVDAVLAAADETNPIRAAVHQ